MNANQIIKHFNMQKHPEGGAYAETYKSLDTEQFNGFNSKRSYATSILFLLQKNEFSAFHKIKSDEIWNFHLGDPLEVIEIDENGNLVKTILGHKILENQKLQHCVMANRWFASRTLGDFSLVGCGVSPGFEYEDFILANRNDLILEYPALKADIESLTH